jgi:hypothetical protein
VEILAKMTATIALPPLWLLLLAAIALAVLRDT